MSNYTHANLLPAEYDIISSNNAALTLFLMGAALLCLFGYCCYCCFSNEQTDMGLELIGEQHEHVE